MCRPSILIAASGTRSVSIGPDCSNATRINHEPVFIPLPSLGPSFPMPAKPLLRYWVACPSDPAIQPPTPQYTSKGVFRANPTHPYMSPRVLHLQTYIPISRLLGPFLANTVIVPPLLWISFCDIGFSLARLPSPGFSQLLVKLLLYVAPV